VLRGAGGWRSWAGAALLCAAWLGGAASAAAAPGLRWHRCTAGSVAASAGFRCASFRVPLDYRHPTGRQITLAVVEHLATRPARRIGALFMNPGGPGGEGTVQIPAWYTLLPATVRQRFDVVSWDPRGVGQSTAVQCFANAAAESTFLGAAVNFPVTAGQKKRYIATWAAFSRRCGARNGALLRHVSTADTARDLDRLRQAVGAAQLTYWGLSYGTILGATYANLFPQRVRALVLDGDVAPSAWTANGNPRPSLSVSLRIGSDVGAGMDLGALLSLCGRATVVACPFSAGSPAATRAKFKTLLARLLRRPIRLDGQTVTYAFLLGELTNGLDISQPFQNPRLPPSDGSTGWLGIAGALQTLWKATSHPTTVSGAAGSGARAERYAGPEQFDAIACGDTPNPRDSRQYSALEPIVLRRAGPIGAGVLWGDEVCASWPAHAADEYRGPWNRPTANPVLVVGNTADPSTPYVNAVKMAAQLGRARLLTVRGYGHTALLNPSACAARYITTYLTRDQLPPPHMVCRQDHLPFEP
jgi:pimeloyl-ACP methyl ester carboxylesterase